MTCPTATRGLAPARRFSPAAGANPELRARALRRAEATIADFANHTDAEIRAACEVILNHPGIDGLVFKRAEMTLQAIGGAR